MVRVNTNDPNLIDIGFDGSGDPIFDYNDVLFTGIEEGYDKNNPNILRVETEYQNGYLCGLCRNYYPNGQLELEYTQRKRGFDGRFRQWDMNGNILIDDIWIKGEKQPL